MKVCLTGPSCAGKTTLAKKLKELKGVATLDLDLVFLDIQDGKCKNGIQFKSEERIRKEIGDFLKNNRNWIIEGVFAVEEIFREADLIVMLKPPIVVPLFRQWKRFFTDEFQRKTFGIKSNLFFLTPDIFKQYFSDRGCGKDDNLTIYGNKKTYQMMKRYNQKSLLVGEVKMDLARDIFSRINSEKDDNL